MRSFLSGETTPAMLESIGLRKLESFFFAVVESYD